jgi:hypothetical protein
VVEDKVFVLRPHALSLFNYLHTLSQSEAVDVVFWTNSSRSHSQWLLSQLSKHWESSGRPNFPNPVACKRSESTDPSPANGSLFSKAIFADDVKGSLGPGMKRMTRIGLDLKRSVLIENSPANVADEEKGSAIIVPDFEWNAPPPSTLEELAASRGGSNGEALFPPPSHPKGHGLDHDDALLVVIRCLERIVASLRDTPDESSVARTLELCTLEGMPSTHQRLHRSPTGFFVVK